MPNISFFIPAYNCSTTIIASVESIMTSNFSPGDELIIVNDGSTDDTASSLNQIKDKYPQIIVINHILNKGGAAARNTAVANARYELLFCLDADNVLAPDSIGALKRFLKEQQADIVAFSEVRYFSESTGIIDETWSYEPGVYTIDDLLHGKLSPGGSGNYLFTKGSWLKARGYAEDLGALDTWAFGFKQLMEGCKMMVMPGSFYFHRRGHESYYIRDAWNRRRSVSLRLIKLIIDYIDRIHPADVDYIFSRKGRYSWFDNLHKRPIRLSENAADPVWLDHELKISPWEKARYYKTRLLQVLGFAKG